MKVFSSRYLSACFLIIAVIGLIFTVAPTVGATSPITLDNVSTADNDGGGPVSMLSWSHTVASGASILIVGVSEASAVIPPTVVSVTFGSSSLTPIGAGQSTPTRVELWSLLNPTAGSATVTVLLSGVETGVFGGAASYFNVIGTTSFTTSNDQGSTVTTPSISVPAVSGELVIDVLATCSTTCSSSPTPPVPSPGSTSTYISTEINHELFAAASAEPAASPVTLSWVYTSNYWAMAAVALIPAPSVSLSANPSSVTVTAGSSASTTITATILGVDSINELSNPAISCSGLPSGGTCSTNPSALPSPMSSGQQFTLTINVPSSTSPGTYQVTVEISYQLPIADIIQPGFLAISPSQFGSSGGIGPSAVSTQATSNLLTITVVVNAPPPPPPIPEYPLGLPILVIFMIIAFGLIKRGTKNRKNT